MLSRFLVLLAVASSSALRMALGGSSASKLLVIGGNGFVRCPPARLLAAARCLTPVDLATAAGRTAGLQVCGAERL